MNSEFVAETEVGANKAGEILHDAGELKNVSCPSGDGFAQDSVNRTEILDFGNEGFLLHGLFSPQECRHYIDKGEEVGFEPLFGVKEEYRSCHRVSFRSQELADLLWARLAPFLSTIVINGDPKLQHIQGIDFLLQGTWQPLGLNPVFRLCRYLPGGHFSPHFDGHFSASTDQRSLQTLMLYLNGDFIGGSTNFVDEKQVLYKDENGKFCAEEKNVLYRIQPEPGMAIVFNHHRLHEGEKLGDGRKYILRTDIMFRNVSPSASSEADQKALLMLQDAERKEACGECMEAAELYRKAFKLSPSLAKAYGN
ncbi:uncharacterized protein [Haliotis asinina]|uniref:uncharacterized protein n=1 Tax=Haliotis asinina TaxID=109174 RepID=UPI0035327EEB